MRLLSGFAVALGAGCAPVNTITLERGTSQFKRTVGNNDTNAWDALPPVDGSPPGGTTRLAVEGTVPRELVILDRSPAFPGAPVDPPALIPTFYATRSGAAITASSASATSSVYPRAARYVDHGAAYIAIPWVTGVPDGNGIVRQSAPPDASQSASFFPQLASKLYAQVEAQAPDDRNAKVMRLGAIYRPWFRQADGSSSGFNQDGFFLWDKIQFKGLRTVLSIPYTREIILAGHFQLHAEAGDVRIEAIVTEAGGDVPDDSKTTAKAILAKEVPTQISKALHDALAIPMVASCDPGDHACCQRQWPAGLAASLQGAGFAAGEASAMASAMPQPRVFADDNGSCKYSMRALRVNILPDHFEVVLSDADKPMTPEGKAACKLSVAVCSAAPSAVDHAAVTTFVPAGP